MPPKGKSSKLKEKKDKALGTINAALTILDKFPKLDETNSELSANLTVNPFAFLMDLFKSTQGYDKLIEILSKFLVYELPAVEIAVKGVLLSHMKNIISCSINPFITEELIRNGIVFNLRQLDLIGMLNYNPLGNTFSGYGFRAKAANKTGQYFYFGCENMEGPDDTKDARDFNALLWYMINRSNKRVVWRREKDLPTPFTEERNTKSDGIVTLEYSERAAGLKDATGGGMNFQSPLTNCLHVFIGNTDIANENVTQLENEIKNLNSEIKGLQDENASLYSEIQKDESALLNIENDYINNTIDETTYISLRDTTNSVIKGKRDTFNANETEITNLVNQRQQKSQEIRNIVNAGNYYSNYKVKNNYYYNRTLLEFNYDFITSLKLFDAKVLTAQLIDAMTQCLAIDLGVSYERLLLKFETEQIVKAIIENDDVTVNDCFFTFDNESYNNLVNRAEMVRKGLFSLNGEQNGAVQVDALSLLNSLNTINDSAEPQNIQATIEGSITEISKTLTNTEYSQTGKVNFGIQMNFIENLLNNLAYVLAMTVLSPKVYLLLAINIELLGPKSKFSFEDFLAMHKQLIASIIRAIVDQLLQYLINELMKLVSELAKEISVRLTIEQAQYYQHLIKRLIACFKKNRHTLDFKIDDVDYADIINTEEEPTNNEC